MANKELRRRLAAAAGVILDDDALDQIHKRLVSYPDKVSMPVTVKYDFRVDADGALLVEIAADSKVKLGKMRIQLRSEDNQLVLWGDDSDTRRTEAAPETEAAPADDPEPSPRPRSDPRTVSDRIKEIQEKNEAMYRGGMIDRAQAQRAGVDVDAIDASR